MLPNQLQSMRANLQQQLAQIDGMLSRQTAAAETPAPQAPAAVNIQQLVQQEIQRQIAAVIPAQPLMAAIGSALSVEDQQWLSANLPGLPAFLQTKDGTDLVTMAVDAYKKHLSTPAE